MNINLICSANLKPLLSEALNLRGLTISANASLAIVEKGYSLPTSGLVLYFDFETLNDLTALLDTIAKKADHANKKIIIGQRQGSDSLEIISYPDIMYFESQGNYVYCKTLKDSYKIKNKLYELEISLMEQGFIRISKSFLVNIMNVAEIVPWFGSRLLLKLKNNAEVEVSRNYVRMFKDFLEL